MDAKTETSFQPFLNDLTVPHPDEETTTREIDEAMAKIRETTFENSGHAIRSVHAKSHGLIEAELEIWDGLPKVLAQEIFAKSGRHPVVMLFPTIPGDILPDSSRRRAGSRSRSLMSKASACPATRICPEPRSFAASRSNH